MRKLFSALKYSVCLATLLLLMIYFADAQERSLNLKGKVVDNLGEPVYTALVKIQESGAQKVTDGDGFFSFEHIAPGNYHLQIRSLGYKSIQKEITISENDTALLHFVLQSTQQQLEAATVTEKTASRKLNESGFHVNAIDMSTYANTNADINQVLNVTTGVRIREEGGLGSNFKFSLNGFSGNQVKFFMDGLPMDNFGSSLTLNNFPVNMAERVEVYKGVLPINLGTDALGGAVNIVTRSNSNYLDVSYAIGSFNTHRASVNGAYTNQKTGFTVRTNAFFNYSDNNYKVLAPIKNLQTSSFEDEEWVKRFHDNYQSAAIQLEAGLTNKRYADKLLFGIIASENDKDLQTGVVMEEVYGAMKTKSHTIVPSLKYQKKDLFIKGLETNLYTAYNRSSLKRIDTTSRIYNWRGEWIPNPSYNDESAGGERGRTQNENTDREWLLTNNWNYRINAQQGLALNYTMTDFHRKGYDVENPEALENRFPTNLTKHILGLSYNLDVWNKWTTSFFGKWYFMNATGYEKVGAFTEDERYEATSYSYNNPGFGVATAMFIYPQLQAKASFERTYRLPESGEIFGDGVFTVANYNLKPERSNNFNVGLRYASKEDKPHQFSVEGDFIYRLTRDYIRMDQSVSGGNRSMENKGKVRTMGGEGEIKYDYKHRLFASINATYQQILDKQEFEQSGGYTGGATRNITYDYRLH
ncbi:TonB-dependent receptor [Olivibacter ginsenosidimutans]|uniref:TonB-dependent receptor n=1 Tax=Olivibacter ginsenosidimutans TaxID=1176537 RepID=A0ABP9B7E6_9SPHI